MTTRTAGGGCGAVRRARGVLLALCAVPAALTVLAHHDTTAVPMGHSHTMNAHVAQAARVGHVGRGAPGAETRTVTTVSRTVTTMRSPAPSDSRGPDAYGCATADVHHCASAGIPSGPPLAVPGDHGLTPPAGPAPAGRTSAARAVTAPPDLSALSQLRI